MMMVLTHNTTQQQQHNTRDTGLWSKPQVAGMGPEARLFHSATLSSSLDVMYVFGGKGLCGVLCCVVLCCVVLCCVVFCCVVLCCVVVAR